MMLSRDAGVLAASLSKAFPDAVLVQPVWESGPLRVRCRQIAFLMDSDRMVSIAIGCESGRLQRMLAAEDVPAEEFESVLSHRIDLVRVDEGRDLTGSAQIKARGADALGLDYHVIHHSRYQIRSQFLTDDVRAQSIMKTLLDIIDTHFCRGLQIVRLQTGEVIAEDRDDEEDTKSYSRRFREWCARGPKRYLSVGLRAVPGGEGFDFVGVRPVDDGIVRVAPND